MSRLRLLLGIVAIGLLVAAPASATYMNLAADSNWTFTITGGGYTLSNVANLAQKESNAYNPVETVPSTYDSQDAGIGASVSVDSTPNLLHQEAYNTPAATSGTSHTHVTGQGPTAPGYLYQDALQAMAWSLVVDTTTTYAISATNNFSVTMVGTNASGVGAYKVDQLYTYALSLQEDDGGLDVSNGGFTRHANEVALGDVVPIWNASETNQTQTVNLGSQPLTAGQTYYLIVVDETEQFMNTYTAVPVPPSLILLGSGLVGLVGLRYRRRF